MGGLSATSFFAVEVFPWSSQSSCGSMLMRSGISVPWTLITSLDYQRRQSALLSCKVAHCQMRRRHAGLHSHLPKVRHNSAGGRMRGRGYGLMARFLELTCHPVGNFWTLPGNCPVSLF